jgi:hypothetical protein
VPIAEASGGGWIIEGLQSSLEYKLATAIISVRIQGKLEDQHTRTSNTLRTPNVAELDPKALLSNHQLQFGGPGETIKLCTSNEGTITVLSVSHAFLEILLMNEE